jgi:hypothetical protein
MDNLIQKVISSDLTVKELKEKCTICQIVYKGKKSKVCTKIKKRIKEYEVRTIKKVLFKLV